jgi:hypothetical protein
VLTRRSNVSPKHKSCKVSEITQPKVITASCARSYWALETDCVAGHIGLELRNVVANYPFERSHRFAGSSRILATETVRV